MIDMNLGDTQAIIAECKKQKLTKEQCAYVLASAYWESGRTMRPVREAFWLSEEWRKKNLTRYYPYYGRGYVQITWANNYSKASVLLSVNLSANPDLALEKKYALPILVLGMKEGWFTGKKLSDYIQGTKKDYEEARRIVNGTDRAATIAGLAESYEEALFDYNKGGDWNFLFDLIKKITELFEK